MEENVKVRKLLIAVLVLLMASGCANKRAQTVVEKVNKPVKVEGVDRSSALEVVKQPIYSTNLIRKKIPENLKQLKHVYKAPEDCDALLQELELLNLALGEDLIDKPNPKDDVFTLDLGQMVSKEVESNIPFNSIIKRLSGARKHEKEILSAKTRGKSRRSYLQGWSDAMQCQRQLLKKRMKLKSKLKIL